jgi:hypothetical protein
MQRKFFSVLLPVALCAFTLIMVIKAGMAQSTFESPATRPLGNRPAEMQPFKPLSQPNPSNPTACAKNV